MALLRDRPARAPVHPDRAHRRRRVGSARPETNRGGRGLPGSLSASSCLAAAAVASATILARWARLTRRGVLGPLDQDVRHDQPAVLVLGDELEADAAPVL